MIKLAQARHLLLQAVETQGPNFVYAQKRVETCFYKADPGLGDNRAVTGCLIGVALDLAGETRHHDFYGDVTLLAERYPDMMDHDTARYLQIAQLVQDQGGTWGEAYQQAEEKADGTLGEVVTPWH